MRNPKTECLCIGIGEKGKNDAIDWEAMLKRKGINVHLLLDKDATIRELDAHFKKIVAQIGKATTNYLFYSGPGLVRKA